MANACNDFVVLLPHLTIGLWVVCGCVHIVDCKNVTDALANLRGEQLTVVGQQNNLQAIICTPIVSNGFCNTLGSYLLDEGFL